MAQEKDKVEKILEDYKDVFADICNTLIFQKRYLQEELLQSGETESIYKAEKGELANQYRDKIMHYGDQTLTLASNGIENQSTVEKYMPIRIMGYDFASYQRQVNEGKAISPVLTIVLNFSDTRWTKSRNLHSLMNMPEEFKPHVQDYCIKVFDVAYLEDEVIEHFTSDFKVVARFFKSKRLGKDGRIYADTTEIKHVEAVMNLFKVFTGDSTYSDIYQKVLESKIKEGEKITMCKVVDYYMNQGRMEGLRDGRLEGLRDGRLEGKCGIIFEMVQDGDISIQIAASRLNLSAEEIVDRMIAGGYQIPTAC